MEYSREQRLFDGAARHLQAEPTDLIEVATQGLVDGLDSPSLRDLAAASRSDRAGELRSLLLDALDELSVPRPDLASPGQKVVVGGTRYARLPTDRLRLEVVSARGDTGDFEMLIHINDVEITAAGAGMGMHPFDLLVPSNRLVATAEPRRELVARCTCGESGCGSTEARITRDEGVVHWEWYVDAPLGHGVTFDAATYDAEVERITGDDSWQRPVDNVTRLVLEAADRELLAAVGLRLNWAAADHRDPRKFLVALDAGDEKYQVFLRFALGGRTPEQLAGEVVQTLRLPPGKWRATFHSMVVGRRGRPSMAGWRWRSEDPW